MAQKPNAFLEPHTDFSLVQGGPLFRLLVRTHLSQPSMDLLVRRIMFAVAITWLPLLVLSALSGDAVGGSSMPYQYDVGAPARFLLALPLLLVAEVVVHKRLKVTMTSFLDQGLITPEDRPRFEEMIASAMRLRNSVVAEILVIVLTLVAGHFLNARYVALQTVTWYATPVGDQFQLNPAGYWYVFVSLMLARFLIFRWYFRIFIWWRLLWQISRRIKLNLNALHPDEAGGLGILTGSAHAMMPILIAHTVGISGALCGKILYEGATLPQYKLEIVAWVLYLMCLVLAPMFFFTPQLAQARRTQTLEYSQVAARYVSDFRRKWIDGPEPKDQALLGSADIQSLGDLSTSFSVAKGMGVVPFGRTMLMQMAIVIALPFAPLLLTMISLEQLVDRALSIFV
jgi:hypothetical protein